MENTERWQKSEHPQQELFETHRQNSWSYHRRQSTGRPCPRLGLPAEACPGLPSHADSGLYSAFKAIRPRYSSRGTQLSLCISSPPFVIFETLCYGLAPPVLRDSHCPLHLSPSCSNSSTASQELETGTVRPVSTTANTSIEDFKTDSTHGSDQEPPNWDCHLEPDLSLRLRISLLSTRSFSLELIDPALRRYDFSTSAKHSTKDSPKEVLSSAPAFDREAEVPTTLKTSSLKRSARTGSTSGRDIPRQVEMAAARKE